MPRATDDLVEAIIEIDPDIALTPFIKAANTLVTKCCASVEDYTDDDLQQIEVWLAAHIYATRDPRSIMEQAGSVQETFQSRIDLGLDNSHYGQMAKRLDWNGGLAALDNGIKTINVPLPAAKKSTGITWLGTSD